LVTAGVVSVSNRPSGAPSCITAPPVKGVLEALNASRKGFFEEMPNFLVSSVKRPFPMQ
ncbi:MAG: hypothetical protein ACJA2X_002820, partial [Halocynthiibacter sp.]